MRQEKMNQRQRIARLEKVSSMNYIRISKLEELVAELRGVNKGTEESKSEDKLTDKNVYDKY